MSWRVIIVLLLIASVVAWQGGVQLGEYLVSRAPETVASASRPKESNEKLLDANGRPVTAQPPQPRIDGTLGIPRERTAIDWAVSHNPATPFSEESNLMKIDAEGRVIGDTAEGGYERRDHELSAGGNGLPQGQNDIATLDITASMRQDAANAMNSGIRPGQQVAVGSNAGTGNAGGATSNAVNNGRPAPAGSAVTARNQPSPAPVQQTWQQKLKSDLEQCEKQGFFQRPTCVQNARNRYCGPNNAWGKMPDCPARSTEFGSGG